MAGRVTAGRVPVGSHSHTWPPATSSQDIQVPQGVRPPAQFQVVPPRMRVAEATRPSAPKRMAEAPPVPRSRVSEFVTRIHPPSGVGKVPWPSGITGKA